MRWYSGGDGHLRHDPGQRDGSYVYTLTKPFDTSPDANNGANTEVNKESFTYQVTDANGNSATGTITVDIVDDVPTAPPTPTAWLRAMLTVTAARCVLTDDTAGADGSRLAVVVGVRRREPIRRRR